MLEMPGRGKRSSRENPSDPSSGKWVGRIYAIFSGEISEVNEVLEDQPELINSSPYDQGWICKITTADLEGEKGNLLNAAELKPFIEAEVARVKELMNK